MQLQEVYDELRVLRLCNSAYDFSVEYLGKDRSYYSVLKATDREPSIEALVMLEFALTEDAKKLESSDHPVICRAHTTIAGLSSEIRQVINVKARNSLKYR